MATKRQKTRHLDTDAGNDTASEALQSREIALSVQNDGFLTPTRLGRAETKLDDFDFDTADNDGLKALVASPTDGPVIVTVYFQCRDGRRQPIGFGMYNTLKIRHDLASFVALESGHKQPFYLNMDILANRRVSSVTTISDRVGGSVRSFRNSGCIGRELARELANSSLVSRRVQNLARCKITPPSVGTLHGVYARFGVHC